MAEHGARVLVLERETHFKDRVRGEGMHAWGVPEAKALGIYELLRTTCGLEVRWWDIYLGSELMAHRDFHCHHTASVPVVRLLSSRHARSLAHRCRGSRG